MGLEAASRGFVGEDYVRQAVGEGAGFNVGVVWKGIGGDVAFVL